MYDPRIPPEIIIVADSVDTAEGKLFDKVDVSAAPDFSVSETATVFFGRSVYWLRKLDTEGKLVCDGRTLGKRSSGNHRVYDLRDIELIAYHLLDTQRITLRRFRLALGILRLVGQQWEILAGDINLPNL